ncbi:HypC/HybG/HupF family hydrogenase formation chaperone [Geitlerinema sp. PCC 7407]|uniref:HypC/HybG/HupF family hydrogenase formation chaperone n=1 Tax=Geitlerinema sp. PCC 7407 TaxID=1173025 RepID=UPI00029FB4E6|nr:HypC/HybG/HupF family hydrogenase formation chaperone [Geitlerinema sp. PCC 7407]AFY66406.1 hydrogenase assembly chaperone hypC/hupF [Geitlerinema sp. PCC 7407]
MCLAVPGQIVSIAESPDHPDQPDLWRSGQVSFGGVLKTISLAYVPEACVGDYVIVHVGFALSVVDEAEAQRTLEDLAVLRESAPTPGTH